MANKLMMKMMKTRNQAQELDSEGYSKWHSISEVV